jgi:hypothetical protein
MALNRIKASYIKEAVDDNGTPTGDLDIFIHFPEFIDEIKKAEIYANANGWGQIRVCRNRRPEGNGRFTHKLKIVE